MRLRWLAVNDGAGIRGGEAAGLMGEAAAAGALRWNDQAERERSTLGLLAAGTRFGGGRVKWKWSSFGGDVWG